MVVCVCVCVCVVFLCCLAWSSERFGRTPSPSYNRHGSLGVNNNNNKRNKTKNKISALRHIRRRFASCLPFPVASLSLPLCASLLSDMMQMEPGIKILQLLNKATTKNKTSSLHSGVFGVALRPASLFLWCAKSVSLRSLPLDASLLSV